MSSASSSASLMFCSTSTIDSPSALSRPMVRPTSATICGARPSDGSSISSTRGLRHQRAADRQHLLLAAGERGSPAGCAVRCSRGNIANTRSTVQGSPAPPSGLARRDGEVLAHGEAAEDAPALAAPARRRAPAIASGAGVVTGCAEHLDRARARRQQADGDVHAGRLAGAVAAEQARAARPSPSANETLCSTWLSP